MFWSCLKIHLLDLNNPRRTSGGEERKMGTGHQR